MLQRDEILSLFTRDNYQNTQLSQEKLHDKLMQDTNGTGKLYKYKPCDVYALSSIICGDMYCADTSQFNDPFDSQISFSTEGMLHAILKRLTSQFAIIIISSIKIFKNELTLNDIPEVYHAYIKILLENNHLLLCFSDSKNFDMRYFETGIMESVPIIFNPNNKIFNAEALIRYPINWAMDIVCTSEELEFVQNGQIQDNIVQSLRPEQAAELREISDKWNKKLKDALYIGCLANSYTNRLMWSHYADSHRGICIEYDFSAIDGEEAVFPIEYRSQLPQFPYDTIFEYNDKNEEFARMAIIDCLLTKDRCWEYEGEWRILHDAKIGHMCNMPPISCICLGAKMEDGLKRTVIQLAKDKGIPVKQMMLKDNTYELFAQDIN